MDLVLNVLKKELLQLSLLSSESAVQYFDKKASGCHHRPLHVFEYLHMFKYLHVFDYLKST